MGMYLYENAVKQLQESGSINLMDLRALPYADLKDLLDEIQAWTLYANGELLMTMQQPNSLFKMAVMVC